MYIEEQKAETLQQAARLADDYSLTHHGVFEGSLSESNSAGEPKFEPSKNTHHMNKPSTRNQRQAVPSSPVCNYCKHRGHVLAECWILQKKRDNNAVMTLVSTKQTTNQTKCLQPGGRLMSETLPEEHHPFVSEGFVSLSEKDTQVPVKVLRDTGASQSLLIHNILPLSERTSLDACVLIQGVELNAILVPLHKVYPHSNLVTGPVTVGVLPTLPVRGVSFILGNDLAGGKVKPDLCVVNNLDPSATKEVDGDDVAVVFPACVVTRAAAQRARMDQELLSSEENNTGLNSLHNLETKETEKDGSSPNNVDSLSFSREQLIHDQEMDVEIRCLAENAISENEVAVNPIHAIIRNVECL